MSDITRSDEINSSKTSFDELRIDNCANRTSAFSICQNKAYCETIGLPLTIRFTGSQQIKEIGGSSKSAGMVIIQVAFSYLDVVIDYSCLFIKEEVRALLSITDMLEKGLDTSSQGRCVSLRARCHQLTLEIYFLVHRWRPEDAPYNLYTELELRTLHRTFGHHSLRCFRMLSGREKGCKTDSTVANALKKIKDDSHICRKPRQPFIESG